MKNLLNKQLSIIQKQTDNNAKRNLKLSASCMYHSLAIVIAIRNLYRTYSALDHQEYYKVHKKQTVLSYRCQVSANQLQLKDDSMLRVSETCCIGEK